MQETFHFLQKLPLLLLMSFLSDEQRKIISTKIHKACGFYREKKILQNLLKHLASRAITLSEQPQVFYYHRCAHVPGLQRSACMMTKSPHSSLLAFQTTLLLSHILLEKSRKIKANFFPFCKGLRGVVLVCCFFNEGKIKLCSDIIFAVMPESH